MALSYNVVEIFTSEGARCRGKSIVETIIQYVRAQKIAARCIATRGIMGCYESGEIATQRIVDISYNMPIKIEVILPAAELERILPGIEDIVTDGIVVVEDMQIRSHRTEKRLVPRHLLVRDVMTASPVAVHPATPVREIVHILLSAQYNGLPVVDDKGRSIGIITQDDLIERAGMPIRLGLLGEFGAHRVDAWLETVSRKTAQDTMTCPAKTIGADRPLTEAIDLMLRHNLKRLPVVESGGKLVGLLARFDIFRTITTETPDWEALTRHNVILQNARFVHDVMRRDTHTTLPDTPVEEIVKVIDANDIQRVAVVDADGKLLGLITDRDLFSAFSAVHGGLWDYLLSKVAFGKTAQVHKDILRHAQARTAKEIMKTDLVTVREEAPLEDAIQLMVNHRLKRVPVVDAEGRFKGMVSRDSLLRAGIAEK